MKEVLNKYNNELDIESFIHSLDDATECYKFYWASAILEIYSWGKREITFDEIVNKMIVDAWYSVAEYHLHLGPLNTLKKTMNSIERCIEKLLKITDLSASSSETEILYAIREKDVFIHSEKMQLIKNVPYRILSPYFPEIDGNNVLWNNKTRLIAYMQEINKINSLPYTIENGRGLEAKVYINKYWDEFFKDNFVPLISWIELKKIKYLQSRNPGVPGIIYKLAPQNQNIRKLKYVHKLWDLIMNLTDVKDIYTGEILNKEYDIDHFIPWSYIANDELWNLLPMKSSLNSTKQNKLPKWEKYFKLFASNQYTMFKYVNKYEFIKENFMKCQRDNMVSPFSLKELYVCENSKEQFFNILESELKPIYTSAKMQGYEIWNY